MPPRPTKPSTLDLLQALWAQAHALDLRSGRMQHHVGVTGPQRLLLRHVGENPGCSPVDVGRRLRIDSVTVSRLVAGLERLRLVQRSADPGRGRRQHLRLTGSGERLNRDARGTVEEAVAQALAGASAAEARSAHRFILRLTEALAPRPGGEGN